MNRVEFYNMLVATRKKFEISFSNLPTHSRSNMRSFEKGVHNFNVNKAIAYLNACGCAICLSKKEEGEIVIHDNSTLLNWYLANRKPEHTKICVARILGCSLSTINNIETDWATISVDVFLKIVEIFDFKISVVNISPFETTSMNKTANADLLKKTSMSKIEFLNMLVDARKKSGMGIRSVSINVGVDCQCLRSFEKGVCDFDMEKSIKYLNAFGCAICLFKSEEEKVIIRDYKALLDWCFANRKDKHTYKDIAGVFGCPPLTIGNIETGEPIVDVDTFLKFAKILDFEIGVVSNGLFKTTPMNRIDFCNLFLEAKEKSGVSTYNLSFAIKMQYSTLRRLERGVHNFNMKKAIEYFDILGYKICLQQGAKKTVVIYNYKTLLDWYLINRKALYTQRFVAKRLGCSDVNVSKIELGQSTMSVDTFLGLLNIFEFDVYVDVV